MKTITITDPRLARTRTLSVGRGPNIAVAHTAKGVTVPFYTKLNGNVPDLLADEAFRYCDERPLSIVLVTLGNTGGMKPQMFVVGTDYREHTGDLDHVRDLLVTHVEKEDATKLTEALKVFDYTVFFKGEGDPREYRGSLNHIRDLLSAVIEKAELGKLAQALSVFGYNDVVLYGEHEPTRLGWND